MLLSIVVAIAVGCAHMDAALRGHLAIVGGCVVQQGLEGHSTIVLWPLDVHWDDKAQAVVFPDDRRLTLGRDVVPGGGGISIEEIKTYWHDGQSAAEALATLHLTMDATRQNRRVGGPVPHGRWSQHYRDACAVAGVDGRTRTHDLRHVAASPLIAGGLSVAAVQAVLGHASPAETLEVYTHLWPTDEERTRTAMCYRGVTSPDKRHITPAQRSCDGESACKRDSVTPERR